MIGGTGLNLRISGVDWDMYEFYLMFLTREIDIKLFQNYTKAYIYIRFCIRFVVLNRPYSTNTQAIWKNVTRTPTNGSAVLLSRVSICIKWPINCTPFWGSSGHMIRTLSYIYTYWYDFDTVLCQFLETGTSDRCLIQLPEILRFHPLHPFIFPLQSL